MFFVCIGVYAANNDFFQVGEVVVIGLFGYILLRLGFHPAPILLGFVLGPRFEENFRRAMLISRGDIDVFVERPISAVFVGLCVLLIGSQIYFRLQRHQAADPSLAARNATRRASQRRADCGGISIATRLRVRVNAGPLIIAVVDNEAAVRRPARASRARARAPADRKTAAHPPAARRRAPAPRRTTDAPRLP